MVALGWGVFRVGGGSGASLTASSSTFLATVSAGSLIASLVAPFAGATYSVVGTPPGQLALLGSTITRGATAPVAGTSYSIKVRAQNAANTRAVEETLTFAAINGVVAPAPSAATLSRTADGSVGQTYTATGTGPFEWVRKSPTGVVSDITGGTGSTYVAADADTNFVLGVRNAGGTTYATGRVLSAAILLDAMDSLTGHSTVGAGTTLTLDATYKVQGAGAIRVNAATSTATAGTDFTGTATLTPAELGPISFYSDRLTEGVINSHQIFLHAGSASSNILLQSDALQLPGGRWQSFNVSELTAFAAAAAAPIRVRCAVSKATTGAAEAVFDCVVARSGGRPTVLLSFDDGYKTIRTKAFDELTNRGLKATVYPAPGLLNSGSGDFEWMTTADLQFLDAAGWDIGCDGSWDDTAVSTDPATAVAAINQVRTWIEANISSRASAFACWSFGTPQSDAVASAVIAAGFRAVRGTQLPRHFHSRFGIGLSTRKKYPSTGIGSSTVPSAVIAQIDQAILRGATLSLHQHSYTESTGNSVFIPASVYKPILDYIAAKRDNGSLDVMTVSEWWARDGGSTPPVLN